MLFSLVEGKTDFADICFLVAMILFIVAAILFLVAGGVKQTVTLAITCAGLAFVALAFLVL